MCWQAVVIGVRRITKTLTPLYANGARNCPYDSYAELDTCRRTLKQGFKPTLGPTLVWSLNFSFRLSGPSDILVCEDGVPCSYLRDVSGMQPDLNNVLATPEAPSMAQLLAEFFRYVPQWVGNHWEWRVRQTVWESMTANCVWEGLKKFKKLTPSLETSHNCLPTTGLMTSVDTRDIHPNDTKLYLFPKWECYYFFSYRTYSLE
jgi:hypothetical protein